MNYISIGCVSKANLKIAIIESRAGRTIVVFIYAQFKMSIDLR